MSEGDSRPRLDLRFGLLALIVVIQAVTGSIVDHFLLMAVAALFLIVGLPHGAFDVWLFEQSSTSRSRLVFVAVYVSTVAAMAVLWLLTPTTALLAFLALSIHHFGEADLPDTFGPAARIARGTFVVGLPLLAHPSQVEPVLRAMGVAPVALATDVTTVWIAALVAVQLLLVATHARSRTRRERWSEAIYVVAWASAFIRLPPLVSFGLYFTLWHAVDHLASLRSIRSIPRAARQSTAAPWAASWSTWLPYAIVPNLVLLGVVFGSSVEVQESTEWMAGIALMVAASLTLPHAILVSWCKARPERAH